jgi:hypothetical protein
MKRSTGRCTLTTSQIIDDYFIENRTKLLDIAAFLDRLERSRDGAAAGADFRMQAFDDALRILAEGAPQRVRRIQMLFSDPTQEPRATLDRKSASGAWDRQAGV